LTRKKQVETLRERGLDWKEGEPLRSLTPKWLAYVTDPDWLNIERWIELAERLPDEERLSETSVHAATEQLGIVNFGIRNYRVVDDPNFLLPLMRKVRAALRMFATQPRPKGIDHFEPTPLTLFINALGLADIGRIKQCPVCNRIFFARRNDQEACTGACSNTARQRRFREKRYYNQNRKRNRIARKARDDRERNAIRSALAKERK
jgi:hypothetical protein